MSEIKPDEKLQEVMDRTMINLRFIKEHAASGGPFEVVQLVNSFTGAMMHPWEDKKRLESLGLNWLSLQQARDLGWPVLEAEPGSSYEPPNYRQMLRLIRNGFAHGNIDFENLEGKIAKIRVCNRPGGVKSDWCALVSVEDMESFL